MGVTWIRTPTRALRLVAVGAAATLAGCAGAAGGADPSAGPTAGTTTVAATTTLPATATTTGDPIQPLGAPGTQARVAGGFPDGGGPVAFLTDVRSAGQATFDRVVLEFGERVPGYRVAYVEPPITEDGSGNPVEVAGSAFLEIRATPASGVDLSGDRPRSTRRGPDRLAPPHAEVVTEVVETGDFEAMVAWTVGLERQVPFGVATLQDPPRLVVDLHHDVAGGAGADGGPGASILPVGGGSTGDVTEEGTGGPVVLTDVRLGAHDGFDRIVFELAGSGEAGYEIGYAPHPTSQGSGEPIAVPGGATLGIDLTGIALPGDAPPGVQAWQQRERLAIRDAQVVEEVVVDSLFEGRSAFLAGLDQRRPFAVARFESPQRIVVDVLVARVADGGGTLGGTCTNPAGFAVGYPSDWSVNAGTTVPACSRFGPGDLDVPESTDVRIAATAFSVEPVPFDRVTRQRPGEVARQELTVDGREAVRIEREVPDGLYPVGTPMTTYAIDLPDGPDGGPRTLVADTIGLQNFDYQRNVEVLEAQVGSLHLDAGGS